jgi:hypothetical protein
MITGIVPRPAFKGTIEIRQIAIPKFSGYLLHRVGCCLNKMIAIFLRTSAEMALYVRELLKYQDYQDRQHEFRYR